MHILNKTPKNRLLTLTAGNVLKVMNGRKTQTRRVISFSAKSRQGRPNAELHKEIASINRDGHGGWVGWSPPPMTDEQTRRYYPKGGGFPCPHGRPGDTLLVAESYQVEQYYEPLHMISGRYLVDKTNFEIVLSNAEWGKYINRKRPHAPTPGRFMYKSLTRTHLLITNIRAERLQDITQGEVLLEGIEYDENLIDATAPATDNPDLLAKWIRLWDGINGRDGRRWADNPWVWVIQFARVLDWADTACQGRTYKLNTFQTGRDVVHVCRHASCDPTAVVDDRPWAYA